MRAVIGFGIRAIWRRLLMTLRGRFQHRRESARYVRPNVYSWPDGFICRKWTCESHNMVPWVSDFRSRPFYGCRLESRQLAESPGPCQVSASVTGVIDGAIVRTFRGNRHRLLHQDLPSFCVCGRRTAGTRGRCACDRDNERYVEQWLCHVWWRLLYTEGGPFQKHALDTVWTGVSGADFSFETFVTPVPSCLSAMGEAIGGIGVCGGGDAGGAEKGCGVELSRRVGE